MEDGATYRRVTSRILQVCSALNASEARYLVIGGAACVLHGYVRATTDVDILIEPTRENAERVLEALSTVGFGFARELTAMEILAAPITVIGDNPAVDIFLGAWSINYRTALPGSTRVDVEGVSVPLVGIDDLIASKESGRPQDVADVEALRQVKRLRAERGEG
jgi:predicted nucleotidyltransferase